jgi:hypothetical protein
MNQKEYHFVPFTDVRRKHIGSYVRISPSGSFTFSRDFCLKHHVTSATRVILHFDKSRKAIGFEFISSDQPLSYALSEVGLSRTVFVQKFPIVYAIDFKKMAGRYDYKEVIFGEVKLIVVQLPS